ncbi:unnamed protein product [Cladocopium goreaui]|uniref:Uncharacterized protein n=1 Tax=Cladocopium goreaui TaxID=2562237 RepID=A0A9P1GHH0_9DINO|nr:unnamed protein product [Cladocopium goreaui]
MSDLRVELVGAIDVGKNLCPVRQLNGHVQRLNPYHTGGQLLIWTEERREVAIPSLNLLFSGDNKADACQKCLDNGGPRRGVPELLPSGRKRKLEDFKAERKQNSTANQSKRKGERQQKVSSSF